MYRVHSLSGDVMLMSVKSCCSLTDTYSLTLCIKKDVTALVDLFAYFQTKTEIAMV